MATGHSREPGSSPSKTSFRLQQQGRSTEAHVPALQDVLHGPNPPASPHNTHLTTRMLASEVEVQVHRYHARAHSMSLLSISHLLTDVDSL